MKLLKSENGLGYFWKEGGEYCVIDKITKEDLLQLANFTLDQPDVEFDSYSEEDIKPLAHRIIYKNIYEKLEGLITRKATFKDEANRLYLKEYEKYKVEESVLKGNGSKQEVA
ncbi:MAG: hypothetical protein WC464_03745 [Bdellovibrionales bacterium]